jgi:D-apiose dehydrogenase
MNQELRFGIIGTGFWARYQLAAWRELAGVRCIALANRTLPKAEALAKEFGVPAVYADAEELLSRERPDFLDIITDVNTHRRFVELAAAHSTPIICQKPLAPSLADARAMIAACERARVLFFVHENWRWQTPIRELKKVLESGRIGSVFRARITYANDFSVLDNQPFLRELDQFILTDIGTHILDTARLLFCQTSKVHRDIKGEDVATVMLGMQTGGTVTCEMSYASRVEHNRFPETYVFAEGNQGSAELGPDYWIRVTTPEGTLAKRCPPPYYAWADARYALAQVAGVACNAHLLAALRGEAPAETTATDNLRTLELVFASYESARTGRAVPIPDFQAG